MNSMKKLAVEKMSKEMAGSGTREGRPGACGHPALVYPQELSSVVLWSLPQHLFIDAMMNGVASPGEKSRFLRAL